MLTHHIIPTSGDAFIKGKSVVSEFSEVRHHIGFCPQIDPIMDLLTGREHLHFYGSLKGIPSTFIAEAADNLLKHVGLAPFADACAGTYSGGNKRKLSLAMALIGKPEVLFLDEPSSGMDPEARRSMWDVITQAVTGDCSAILTTHSMEEAEALCHRIGIIDKGNLVALGSLAYLKNRFGNGYEIEVTSYSPTFQDVTVYLNKNFKEVKIIEEFTGRIRYKVNSDNLRLSQVFDLLEAAKKDLGIKEYSVSQSSLENIFLSLARQANNE
jgi:ABC-type multidrug transport system ATPase subunit